MSKSRSCVSALPADNAHRGGLIHSANMWQVWLLGTILFVASIQPSKAQVEPEQMAAIMSAIEILLADRDAPIPQPDGEGVVMDLHDRSEDTYFVDSSEQLYAQFDLQDVGTELCFYIDSSQTVSSGDFVVEVNGERVNAGLGENCFQLNRNQQRDVNYVVIRVTNPAITLDVSTLELQSTAQNQLLLPRLTRGEWSERAVRKVLKIFAFGGHATDSQIRTWANMRPQIAIQEMLNFDEHNLKLSPVAAGDPYDDTATNHGTLLDFVNFLSSPSSNLPIPVDARDQYAIDGYNFDDAYGRMITVRGLNPFRQRIGFWETNYHLAANRDVGVTRRQIAALYDLLMKAHEDGLPYHEVIGVAAKSAAIAEQYGHDRNRCVWDPDVEDYVCTLNQDFAREVHQLFFGIFGVNDPMHEDVTIPNTAKMLTDMEIETPSDQNLRPFIDFGTERHHVNPLQISGNIISGADASEKIDNLMPLSILHPESESYLPVYIISGLADDNLSEAKKSQLRASWASMGQDKYFLDFIHAYAISELFHSNTQYKYFTSHERALYLANKNNLENIEAYFGGGYYNGGRAGRTVGSVINDDNAGEFFRPLHNVFGGQTSLEAADSALVFENNYNRLTDDEQHMRQAVQCDTCDQGQPWEKRWPEVLPQRADGQFYVEDVAEWLWLHAVGNLDNYTELERAHLYSILGAARRAPGNHWDQDTFLDFNMLMCVVEEYRREEGQGVDISLVNLMSEPVWGDYCRRGDDGVDGYSQIEQDLFNLVYSGEQIRNSATIQNLLANLGATTLPLNADGNGNANGGADVREHARERVNAALGFIFTTPFIFAEGK